MDSLFPSEIEQLEYEETIVKAFATLTLKDFVGFETGGLEEITVLTGTPTVQLGIIP